MSPGEVIILLCFLAIIWYWLDGMSAKELARKGGLDACNNVEVHFLDESVVLNKLRLKRDGDGRVFFNRHYQFEFTSDGSCRYRGDIVLLGKKVMQVTLEPHRFTIH
ncbi:MAG TPA: DUF3301 domain-containing protein [Gammaproteobacteria bacterium]|nr:DUF3301 domain-containing protein [Gammaproteobacteria bacterium]